MADALRVVVGDVDELPTDGDVDAVDVDAEPSSPQAASKAVAAAADPQIATRRVNISRREIDPQR